MSEENPGAENGNEENEEKGSQEEQQEEHAEQKGEGSESGEEEFDAERARAKINKVNSEAANLRKKLKELQPLADKAKELEESQKSESQKLTEAKTTAEKNAVTAAQEAARLRVALKKGLTETQAKRLVGETEEELAADADELLADFKPKEEEGEQESLEDGTRRRPTERLKPGATPSAEPDESDPAKLAAQISRDY